jgi:uncharacterized membrane protein YraQ (UPF0718 family)
MEWAAILRDLVLGLLIAGAIAAWVPESFWQNFFLTDHPTLSALWGPIVGPVVAIVSFVCSIGNVPLAAVLWNGGISFGGVVAFIFADLLILPILNIYRKYYGMKMMFILLGTFYASMVCAGYVVELLFGAASLIPTERNATVMEAGISWNYTTWLNIAFLILAAVIALSRRARRIVAANLAIAATFIIGLVLWDLLGHLPLPLGVAGHEGSTVIVGLNGMRLLTRHAWSHRRTGHIVAAGCR